MEKAIGDERYMNRKNNYNKTEMDFFTAKVFAFYPMPVERLNDEDLHRTIIYDENGNKYPQEVSVKHAFESYAKKMALEAGVVDKEKVCIASRYGYQLADGEVFIKVTLQTCKPTEGYINLFQIQCLYDNPSMGIFICMKNGTFISCVSSVTCVYEKIHTAQNYYDPDFVKHPKEGIPFMLRDTAMLPEDIVLGNESESPLVLHTEEQLRVAYDICNHINSMEATEISSGVSGLCKRLETRVNRLEEAKAIRAQGLAAGNGKPIAMDPKSTAHEEMVPRSLLEAERAEKERYKKQNQHLLKALSVGNDEI